MASIVYNRILRIVIRYTINGNRLSSSMHYGSNGALVVGAPTDLLEAWVAVVPPALIGVLSEEVQIEDYYCHAIAPNICNPQTIAQVDVVGLIAGESIPSNISMILQLRQSDVDSNGNGRVYIAGVPESKVVTSLLLGAYVTTEVAGLEAAMILPIVGATAATYTPVAVSRFSGGAPITPVGHTLDQVHAVRSLGTQRRRTTELRRLRA